MQWGGLPSGRFGPDVAESRYLPQDPDPDRPTAAAQLDDEGSLLHLVRRLTHLRTDDPRLDATADVEVITTGYPFANVRGGSLTVILSGLHDEGGQDAAEPPRRPRRRRAAVDRA
ncbi:MAG: hypothetical protein HOV94_30420 [Saccharothrix sp.]|nr:hypothetical protein [Saccharothrix sp.]